MTDRTDHPLAVRPGLTPSPEEAAGRAGDIVREQVGSIMEAALAGASDIERVAEEDAATTRQEAIDAAAGTLGRLDEMEGKLGELMTALRAEADNLSSAIAVPRERARLSGAKPRPAPLRGAGDGDQEWETAGEPYESVDAELADEHAGDETAGAWTSPGASAPEDPVVESEVATSDPEPELEPEPEPRSPEAEDGVEDTSRSQPQEADVPTPDAAEEDTDLAEGRSDPETRFRLSDVPSVQSADDSPSEPSTHTASERRFDIGADSSDESEAPGGAEQPEAASHVEDDRRFQLGEPLDGELESAAPEPTIHSEEDEETPEPPSIDGEAPDPVAQALEWEEEEEIVSDAPTSEATQGDADPAAASSDVPPAEQPAEAAVAEAQAAERLRLARAEMAPKSDEQLAEVYNEVRRALAEAEYRGDAEEADVLRGRMKATVDEAASRVNFGRDDAEGGRASRRGVLGGIRRRRVFKDLEKARAAATTDRID